MKQESEQQPPQQLQQEEDPLHADVTKHAEVAARKLQMLDPPPQIKDEVLAFDNPGGLSVSPARVWG